MPELVILLDEWIAFDEKEMKKWQFSCITESLGAPVLPSNPAALQVNQDQQTVRNGEDAV